MSSPRVLRQLWCARLTPPLLSLYTYVFYVPLVVLLWRLWSNVWFLMPVLIAGLLHPAA
jgi:hypothetical protein